MSFLKNKSIKVKLYIICSLVVVVHNVIIMKMANWENKTYKQKGLLVFINIILFYLIRFWIYLWGMEHSACLIWPFNLPQQSLI